MDLNLTISTPVTYIYGDDFDDVWVEQVYPNFSYDMQASLYDSQHAFAKPGAGWVTMSRIDVRWCEESWDNNDNYLVYIGKPYENSAWWMKRTQQVGSEKLYLSPLF